MFHLSLEDCQKGEQKILEIMVKNGFQKKTLQGLICKNEYKRKIKEVTTLESMGEEEVSFVKISYHLDHFSKFKKVFRKYHLKAAPVNKHTLKSAFHSSLKEKS